MTRKQYGEEEVFWERHNEFVRQSEKLGLDFGVLYDVLGRQGLAHFTSEAAKDFMVVGVNG